MRLLSRVGVVLLIAVMVAVGPLAAMSPARASGLALLGAAVVTNPYFMGFLALMVAGGYVIHNWDQITAPGGLAEWFVTSDLWTPAERLFMIETLKLWVDSGLWLELSRADLQSVEWLPDIMGVWSTATVAGYPGFIIGDPEPGTGFRVVFNAVDPDTGKFLSGIRIELLRDGSLPWWSGSLPLAIYVNGSLHSSYSLPASSTTYKMLLKQFMCESDFAGFGAETVVVDVVVGSYVPDPHATMWLIARSVGTGTYTPTAPGSCMLGVATTRYPSVETYTGVNFMPGRYDDEYSIAVPVNFNDVLDVRFHEVVAGGGITWARPSAEVDNLPYVPRPGEWDDEDTTGLDAGFAGVIGVLNRVGEKITGQGSTLDLIRGGIGSLVGVVSGIGSAVSTATEAVAGIAAQVAALPTTIVTAVEGQLVTWFVPSYTVSTEVSALQADMEGRFPLAVVPIMGCAADIFSGGAAPLVVTLPSPLSPGGTYDLVIEAPAEFQTTCRTVTGFCFVLLLISYYVALARRFLFAGG